MSIYKETVIAIPALAVLLFVSHNVFGPDESYRQTTMVPNTWLGGIAIPDERFLAKDLMTGRAAGGDEVSPPQQPSLARDLTPKARISGVFTQFVPSGGGRPAT